MKLSNMFAKLTSAVTVKRVVGAGVLATAMLAMTAPQAEAQRFVVGVQFGGPRYYAPPPPRPYYYGYGYAPYRYGYWHHFHHYGPPPPPYYGPRY